MSGQPLSSWSFKTSDDAIDALERLGCIYFHHLDLVDDDPVFGKTFRYFGMLGNVLDPQTPPEDNVIVDLLCKLLRDEDNERLRTKLQEGDLRYTPVSKATARAIGSRIAPSLVHLPWAFTAMNADLATRVSRLHDAGSVPLVVFYSQMIELSPGPTPTEPMVRPGRIFSMPVGVDSRGTWLQPIYDELLDEDVGLILEANVR